MVSTKTAELARIADALERIAEALEEHGWTYVPYPVSPTAPPPLIKEWPYITWTDRNTTGTPPKPLSGTGGYEVGP